MSEDMPEVMVKKLSNGVAGYCPNCRQSLSKCECMWTCIEGMSRDLSFVRDLSLKESDKLKKAFEELKSEVIEAKNYSNNLINSIENSLRHVMNEQEVKLRKLTVSLENIEFAQKTLDASEGNEQLIKMILSLEEKVNSIGSASSNVTVICPLCKGHGRLK